MLLKAYRGQHSQRKWYETEARVPTSNQTMVGEHLGLLSNKSSPSLASIQGVYLCLGCYSTVVGGMEMSGSQPWSKNERIWPQDELASNN